LREKMEGVSLEDHLDTILKEVYDHRKKEIDEDAKETLRRRKELEDRGKCADLTENMSDRDDFDKYLFAVTSTYSSRNLILKNLKEINTALTNLNKQVNIMNTLTAKDPSIIEGARKRYIETLKDIGSTAPIKDVEEILSKTMTTILDMEGMKDLAEIGQILGDGRKKLFKPMSWKRKSLSPQQEGNVKRAAV